MSSVNSETRQSRLVAALDVDGVLASWSEGWQGIYHFGPPIPGAVQFTQELSRNMKIIIHTCRCNRSLGMGNRPEMLGQIVTNWLQMNGFAFDEVWTNPGKPVADVYIDDRAIACRPEDGDPIAVFGETLQGLNLMFSEEKKAEKKAAQLAAAQAAALQAGRPQPIELPGQQPIQQPFGQGPQRPLPPGPNYRI